MNKMISTTLLAVAGIMGLAYGGINAQAATKKSSPYLNSSTQYVRLKKTMYVGISQKSGSTYKPLLKKKGSLLAVAGVGGAANDTDKAGNVIIRAAFTSGAVHYNRLKNLKYKGMISIPFKKSDFQPVKLKAPIRTMLFQQGTGFKSLGAWKYATPAAFYLTLDNYLQAYSSTAMANRVGGAWKMTDNSLWKPTSSVKVSKVTVKGNTTVIDYAKPLAGVPNKKISQHHYRLTIKDLKQKHSQSFDPVDDTYDSEGIWNDYTVNGQSYFVGQLERGLD